VPDSDDRYYLLPMLDMWTDVFACPGKRTTGTSAQRYVVAAAGYDGAIPEGTTLIEAPTPHVWIIGRTQTNGPSDYAAVNAFQDGLSITLLGDAVEPVEPTVDVAVEPLRLVNAMSAVDFFAFASRCLKVNRPHLTDQAALARIAGLGIKPGADFDPNRFEPEEVAQIQQGASAALDAIAARPAQAGVKANGWTTFVEGIGVYGNAYLQRAAVALAGLGANPAEDAVYPLLLVDGDGDPLVGERDYVVHFDSDALPPTSAFWSITMYDAEGYQAANELDRFAIGDRDPLRYQPDGSLDVFIQHTNPGPELESNWLPAPSGPLGVTMRVYAPQREALTGDWSPPTVRKAWVRLPNQTP
jgi:hypothetical protein